MVGAAFYLHGEVLPSPNRSLSLPSNLRRTFTPRFEVRGLQPFRERSSALPRLLLRSLIVAGWVGCRRLSHGAGLVASALLEIAEHQHGQAQVQLLRTHTNIELPMI